MNKKQEQQILDYYSTTKRRKLTGRDHTIKTRLAKAKEQVKQPTVAEGKQHRTKGTGKTIVSLHSKLKKQTIGGGFSLYYDIYWYMNWR